MQNQINNASAAREAGQINDYIAISKYGWGRAATQEKAVAKCKRNAPRGKRSGEIKVYSAHPDTGMYGDGSWDYPQGHAPSLVATI